MQFTPKTRQNLRKLRIAHIFLRRGHTARAARASTVVLIGGEIFYQVIKHIEIACKSLLADFGIFYGHAAAAQSRDGERHGYAVIAET